MLKTNLKVGVLPPAQGKRTTHKGRSFPTGSSKQTHSKAMSLPATSYNKMILAVGLSVNNFPRD